MVRVNIWFRVAMFLWFGSGYGLGSPRCACGFGLCVSTMCHIGGQNSPITTQRGRDPAASPLHRKQTPFLGFDPNRATGNPGLKHCNDSVAFPIFDHHFPQEMTWKNGRKRSVCVKCMCVWPQPLCSRSLQKNNILSSESRHRQHFAFHNLLTKW